jgi:hypothetical protein
MGLQELKEGSTSVVCLAMPTQTAQLLVITYCCSKDTFRTNSNNKTKDKAVPVLN